jgi:hypothetical protein
MQPVPPTVALHGGRLRAAAATLCLLASAAIAQTENTPDIPESAPRILIDRSLTQHAVRLVSIGPETVELTDSDGHVMSLARSKVLALVPPLTELDQPVIEDRVVNVKTPETDKTRPYGRLDLVDGQSLPGMLTTASPGAAPAEKDHLAWTSKLFGVLNVPLDNVSAVLLLPDRVDWPRPAAPRSEDVAILINGDRAEGFVSSLDASVKLEKSGKISELPVARVAEVQFANPPKPPDGVWVWLYDGTAVALSQLAADSSGRCTISSRIAGASKQAGVSMDSNDLRAICFDTGSLRPLAPMAATVSESRAGGPGSRRWTPPLRIDDVHGAPLNAADIELPGPMTVEWTLPQGAATLGTVAQLPPSARVWGDCELIVESLNGTRSTPLAKVHLSGASPSAEISVPLAGAGKVRMTIDPGPSGPIQDRVVLRRPMVLVETKH